MPPTLSSTAAAAKFLVALTLLQPPTASPVPASSEKQSRPTQRTTTQWPSAEAEEDRQATNVMPQMTSAAGIHIPTQYDWSDRQTTSREKLIGEIRSWGLLTANWDGEGAAAPAIRSLKEAVSFVRLVREADMLPDAMLHASGHAGLFWKDDGLYAELEFLGDGRVAYYIENQGDKHKGVLKFDSQKLPAVFLALLNL
ncbi:MAG: hypothetical protein ACRD8U_14945 [Pyrinomonadaceae bacterium]